MQLGASAPDAAGLRRHCDQRLHPQVRQQAYGLYLQLLRTLGGPVDSAPKSSRMVWDADQRLYTVCWCVPTQARAIHLRSRAVPGVHQKEWPKKWLAL